MPESMDVFDHEYHFPTKLTREGTVHAKNTNKQTKSKSGVKGYDGPKNLKGHGAAKGGSAVDSVWGGKKGAGVKETGNEYRSPKNHKDVPSNTAVSMPSKGTTAKTLKSSSKKDPIFSGYKGPKQ